MKIKSNFAVLGSLLLASVSANAALTSVTTSAYDAADIISTGTQIVALNATGAGTATGTTTEGGVTWTNFNAASAATAGVSLFGGVTSNSTVGTAGGLTASAVFNGPANNGLLAFSGLADGNYVVQLILSDLRPVLLPNDTLDVYFDDTNSAGTLDATVDVEGVGGMITANFSITGGATQNIYLVQSTAVGDFDGGISAFQVRTVPVPEPSSTALLGLGGLALILRRRK